MPKKRGFWGWVGIIFIFTLIVNIILALISTLLPIGFVKPTAIIEGPVNFFKIPIGHYVLNINQTIVNTWVIMAIITIILIVGTKNLSIENPGKMQIILEDFYNFIDNMFLEGYGEYKSKFISFFSAMFSMILLSNISMFLFPFVFMIEKTEHGILFKPFFRTATADMNTTVGLALVVFVIFIASAIMRAGFIGFIKELSKPFFLMFPINLIGELAKPINISMRLFGNMLAGIVLISLIYGLAIPDALSNLTDNMIRGGLTFAVGWPNVIQLYIDLFVGILQTFVFTILSSVYIKQMLIGDEE